MALGFGLAAAAWVPGASAQEAVRNSLASAEAAVARRKSINSGDYTVRVDPVAMSFSSSAGVQYVSNVFLSSSDPVRDWILQPQFNGSLLWPISEQNSLTIGMGVGYQYYVNTPSYRRFFIAPGSDISFDIYVKDFLINLHSDFQLTQNPTYDPSVSGQGSLNLFQNDTGVQVDWDLNKLLLTFNYDHRIGIYTEQNQSDLSYDSDQFSARASTRVHPALMTGLELGGGLTEYQGLNNDNTHISAGPMARWQVTQTTSVRAAIGYALYMFAPGTVDLPDFTGFYGTLAAQQQLTRNVSHSLSGGKELQVNIYGTPLDLYFVQYQANLNIIRNVGLTCGLLFQNGTEYSGNIGNIGNSGRFNRVGLTAGATYRLTRRISTQLAFQAYWKVSDNNAYDYTQNNISLQATYRF